MTDGRARWAMLALLFTTRIGLGFQFQTMGSATDSVVHELGLSFAEAGTLIGLFMIPGLVLSLPAGFAGRYASDRVLTSAGLALLALGGAVAAMADGFAGLAAGRLLCGAGFVLCSIFYTKMTADWFTGHELATAMAVLVTSWATGIAMGQISHSWLALHYGWRLPFVSAAIYCAVAAVALMLLYRPPPAVPKAVQVKASAALTSREWTLTLLAALVWSAFNCAYVIYLSFAPRLLEAGGIDPLSAASIVSLASWVILISAATCGAIADRTGRAALILSLALCCGMAILSLLRHVEWAVPLSLAYGLLGMAPAGLIMALTEGAMAPHKRAFGMGVFFSLYFLLMAPTPGIAGWLYDRTHDPYVPILFAVGLFALTFAAHIAYRICRRAWPQPAS
ncbi:MAG: MFS transporter [Proteobacteria bacterium]|nr:MFS transporter [Pseudomonadota bacterium]